MCTLIVGLDVLGPGTLAVAANRDEDPARPSDPPGVLSRSPRVAGGRDRVAGGTWLAVRGSERVVAMLNRRPMLVAGAPPERSRGRLAIDVAIAEDPRACAAAEVARRRYAPFSLLVLSPLSSWLLAWDGAAARGTDLLPGWHVITHADLDDRDEPRTAFLLDGLVGWQPRTHADLERGLRERLARHEEPRVCLHDGLMQTVSWSLVTLEPGRARYLHGEGRPCEREAEDSSHLLASDPAPATQGDPA